MVNIEYRVHINNTYYSRLRGKNLYDAIATDERIWNDFVSEEVDYSLTEDADWHLFDYFIREYTDFTTQHGEYPEVEITRQWLRDNFSEEVCEQYSEEYCYDSCYSKFVESLWDRAGDSVNHLFEEISEKSTDEEVAEHLCLTYEIDEIENEQGRYNINEVVFCPYCDYPSAIELMPEEYEYVEDEPLPSNTFFCCDCRSEYGWADEALREKNKQLSEQWIVSRLI